MEHSVTCIKQEKDDYNELLMKIKVEYNLEDVVEDSDRIACVVCGGPLGDNIELFNERRVCAHCTAVDEEALATSFGMSPCFVHLTRLENEHPVPCIKQEQEDYNEVIMKVEVEDNLEPNVEDSEGMACVVCGGPLGDNMELSNERRVCAPCAAVDEESLVRSFGMTPCFSHITTLERTNDSLSFCQDNSIDGISCSNPEEVLRYNVDKAHTSSESGLVAHQRSQEKIDHLTCGHCEITFSSMSHLVAHICAKELGGDTNWHINHLGEKRFCCKLCKKLFKTMTSLKIHNHHNCAHRTVGPFSCEECGKSFKQSQQLLFHKNTHRKKTSFSCKECGKCFPRRHKLIEHERIHTGEVFSCSECDKCFSSKSYVEYHKRIHHKKEISNVINHKRFRARQTLFLCNECDEWFLTRGSWSFHKHTSHIGEKPFSCHVCGKSFKTSQQLLFHKNTHIISFPCKECGKCFSIRANLINHERFHTGENPFLCEECGRSFKQSKYLLLHKNVHTKENLLACNKCGKSFSKKSNLFFHMNRHNEEADNEITQI